MVLSPDEVEEVEVADDCKTDEEVLKEDKDDKDDVLNDDEEEEADEVVGTALDVVVKEVVWDVEDCELAELVVLREVA